MQIRSRLHCSAKSHHIRWTTIRCHPTRNRSTAATGCLWSFWKKMLARWYSWWQLRLREVMQAEKNLRLVVVTTLTFIANAADLHLGLSRPVGNVSLRNGVYCLGVWCHGGICCHGVCCQPEQRCAPRLAPSGKWVGVCQQPPPPPGTPEDTQMTSLGPSTQRSR